MSGWISRWVTLLICSNRMPALAVAAPISPVEVAVTAAVGLGGKKGAIGQLADLVALTDDYLSMTEENIQGLESVLTIIGGKVVHARDDFVPHVPPPIPVLP